MSHATPLAPPHTDLDEGADEPAVLPTGVGEEQRCRVVGCPRETVGDSELCLRCESGVSVRSLSRLTRPDDRGE